MPGQQIVRGYAGASLRLLLITKSCTSVDKLYRRSRLQHHQFCTSGDLIACAAEEAGHHTVLRGGDLLLHLHRFEDEERCTGFDMFAGLHEDMDDLPSHGSTQVTSASGGRPSTLAGVK